MPRSYLGLGSNLENPTKQVTLAIEQLASLEFITLIAQSSLYQSKALLHPSRPDEILPDYINAVIAIETSLTPLELLHVCQHLENSMGRVRSEKRWEARVIDIDLLLFDQLVISTKELTLPHPEMKNRAFVLKPLFEIAPELVLPDGAVLKNLVLSINNP